MGCSPSTTVTVGPPDTLCLVTTDESCAPTAHSPLHGPPATTASPRPVHRSWLLARPPARRPRRHGAPPAGPGAGPASSRRAITRSPYWVRSLRSRRRHGKKPPHRLCTAHVTRKGTRPARCGPMLPRTLCVLAQQTDSLRQRLLDACGDDRREHREHGVVGIARARWLSARSIPRRLLWPGCLPGRCLIARPLSHGHTPSPRPPSDTAPVRPERNGGWAARGLVDDPPATQADRRFRPMRSVLPGAARSPRT